MFNQFSVIISSCSNALWISEVEMAQYFISSHLHSSVIYIASKLVVIPDILHASMMPCRKIIFFSLLFERARLYLPTPDKYSLLL